MPLRTLFGQVRSNFEEVLAQNTTQGKKLWAELLDIHPADLADFLPLLTHEHAKELLLKLPPGFLCQVFTELNEANKLHLLGLLPDDDKSNILGCLTPDQLADIFAHLSDANLEKYSELIPEQNRDKVLSLLKHHPESAGGIMNPDVFVFTQDMSIQQALDSIRKTDIRHGVHNTIFVIDEKKNLAGHLVLSDLVIHPAEKSVEEVMRENQVVVPTDEDRESVAQKMVKYNVDMIPVAEDDQFLGAITRETLVDVLEEEAAEDVYRMAAMSPVRGTYFSASFFELLWKRSYILIVLLLAQSFSSMVIGHYESFLTSAGLVIFITMLISTGGNASNQTSAVIIQGMASGEINAANMPKFFRREFTLAFAMAIILSFVAYIRVYLTCFDPVKSLAVATSLGILTVVAIVVGSLTPIALKKIGIDPAFGAGPFSATVMDVLGLLVYCTISGLVIGCFAH